jgi:hypothetical protein
MLMFISQRRIAQISFPKMLLLLIEHFIAWWLAALVGLAGLVAASLAAYAALYLAVGGPFKPNGLMWTLCMLWVTSHVGGYISAQVIHHD